jgi:hypothetical protein
MGEYGYGELCHWPLAIEGRMMGLRMKKGRRALRMERRRRRRRALHWGLGNRETREVGDLRICI